MSRRRGLFEVVIGLVIIGFSIPIIMISLPIVIGQYGIEPFFGSDQPKPNIPELITGSIGVFIGIVLIVDGLRRSILKGREGDRLKEIYEGARLNGLS